MSEDGGDAVWPRGMCATGTKKEEEEEEKAAEFKVKYVFLVLLERSGTNSQASRGKGSDTPPCTGRSLRRFLRKDGKGESARRPRALASDEVLIESCGG